MHAPASVVMAALALAAIPLTGCGSGHAGASLPVPSVAMDMPNAGYEWTGGSDGTGIFPVGTKADDRIPAVIPQGRYQMQLSPGAQDGLWMLCNSTLCGPAHQENATVVGHPIGPTASTIYIGPGSQTVWLENVVLRPLSD